MEDLKEFFTYDEMTGVLSRTKSKWGSKVGPVTTKNGAGYYVFKHNQKQYYVHRVAWWFIFGEMPDMIDHIDRDRQNNCISNLRLTTYKDNSQNLSMDKRNISGYTGITWNKKAKMWIVNKADKYLGCFKNIEDAIKCREDYCKEFKRKE